MTRGVHALLARAHLKLGTAATSDVSAFDAAGAATAAQAAAATDATSKVATETARATAAEAALSARLASFAYQVADSSPVNNSTTAVALTDLALAVAANSKYLLTMFVPYSAALAADVGFTWSGPASYGMVWTVDAPAASSSTSNVSVHRGSLIQSSIGIFGGIGVGTKMVAKIMGVVTTGSTAGTLTPKFAQGAPDVSDAVVHANAWIKLEKVA